MNWLRHIVYASALTCSVLPLAAQNNVVLNVDAGSRGADIGKLHYGIFFEEINHAGDGGLYAELVQNRSFEDNTSSATAWSAVSKGKISLVTDGLLNDAQKQALKLTFNSAGDGVQNSGFWGMNIVKGNVYKFSAWVKNTDGWNGKLTVQLNSSKKTSLGSAEITLDAVNKDWTKVTASITATGSDAAGTLSILGSKSGSIVLDVVSLFPPTYKDRDNGCRPDLAEKLEAMHPAFMRFPGGCYVEGQSQNGLKNRFEWKKTVGPIEQRPGHMNVNWNYNVSDGLGFHEMLQLAEDIGAEPLFVVNMGMGHGWVQPYDQIDEYIQEALDALEYCNGDVTTKYGAMRAANGHPEPFNLRLLEIGNENYNYTFSSNSDQSDHYAERYRAFYDAVKAKYPEVMCIGNVEAWGTDNPSWRNSHPVDAVDEHYYRNPAWFASQYTKYDAYDRSRPKVYVGEYAVTSNYGTNGHLTAALGEAVYMLGMERNSDMCIMNSYAPIFVNENDQKWKPDMIRFNASESYGTPSYYVQQLMPTHVGKQNVKWTEEGNSQTIGGGFGLSTWSTVATYDNLKVTSGDGTMLFQDTFTSLGDTWKKQDGGNWFIQVGQLKQGDASMQGKFIYNETAVGDNYTFEVDAKKISGSEGFLVAFKYKDSNNYLWWNLGGWSNTKHAVEYCKNGSKTTLATASGSIITNKTYKIRVVVAGAHVQCYLNDELIHEFDIPTERKVYVASSIDDAAKKMYVKVVNTSADAVPATINVNNARIVGGKLTLLTSADGTDENTIDNQTNVAPTESELSSFNDHDFTYEVPAYSLNIFTLDLEDITLPDNAGKDASASDLSRVKEYLKENTTKLNFLHADAKLPTSTNDGESIKWTLDEKESGYVSLSQGTWSTMLKVNKQPEGKSLQAATLKATVTMADGSLAKVDVPVTLAPRDTEYGYLYCFMNPNKEITNFALGTLEDQGKKFQVLLNGEEVFNTSELAQIEHGTRDAYMQKGQREGEYFMTTTDMKNAVSGVWSNYGMNLLRSKDLIHWESTTFDFRKGKKIFSDPEATTDAYKTDAEYANMYRVWAPQFIWDPTAYEGKGAYLVYYSLLSKNNGDNHDVIYYSYADADFKTLTQPRVFFDPGYAVIDGDIVFNPYDSLYHFFYKREGASGADRGVYEATCNVLVGGTWDEKLHVTNEGSEQVEGSSAMRRINEDIYNLYYMRYSGGSAYKVCELDNLCMNPTSSAALQGTGSFQHGSVLPINQDEYEVLQAWSDLRARITEAESFKKESGLTLFDEALANAEKALAKTSVEELHTALPAAINEILDAKRKYIESLVVDGKADLTAFIVNADFSNGSTGWTGTAFTAASNGVAEQWNKTYDTYQILQNMPAGTYTLTASGFYRNGGNDAAHTAHTNGTEQLNALLYMNEASTPFMSLYDDAVKTYTWSPYTYPNGVSGANTAFNTDKNYGGNEVVLELKEAGDIRLGVKKTVAVDSDWNCFDNFSLSFKSNKGTGINSTISSPKARVNVYSASGLLLKKGVKAASATKSLPSGVYIVGGKKVVVK